MREGESPLVFAVNMGELEMVEEELAKLAVEYVDRASTLEEEGRQCDQRDHYSRQARCHGGDLPAQDGGLGADRWGAHRGPYYGGPVGV